MISSGLHHPYAPQGWQACPRCHQTDCVRKISAIVIGGVTNTAFSGETEIYGYTYRQDATRYTTMTGQSQTLQSTILSPPLEPIYRSPWSTWSILGIVFFGFITLMSLCARSLGIAVFTFLLGILIIVLNATTDSKRQAELAIQHRLWEKAMYRWNNLYYCERDDGVFMPGPNAMLVPSRYMMESIYRP